MNYRKYILFALALIVSVGVRGQYNPTNPAEPGAPVMTYTLTLVADPSSGGSFNVSTPAKYAAGTNVGLTANRASNFTFVSWEEDGVIISENASFTYTMPARNVRLVAHYNYTPSSPTEPAEPNLPAKPVYARLTLTSQPAAGGTFNIASGNSYEVGKPVSVQARPNSNFTFRRWMLDGEVISESATFSYDMVAGDENNCLTAVYEYTPAAPGEPSEPPAKKIYHCVNLEADPVGGGTFNQASGNQYEEGTSQNFRANASQWYTFQNWTLDGEVISTRNEFSFTIPTSDVTLVAHYTYNYNPNNPGEPSAATTKRLNLYGMTTGGALGQNIIYPVYLENTEDFYGVTVVLTFPDGFTPNTSTVMLSQRAADHSVAVTSLGGNAYRFDITGTTLLTGGNGKIFELPVAIGASLTAGQNYVVALSNGARINLDNSKEVINTRNGAIYVENMKEDGLYAQFSYDKLQARVRFNNLSSDKAVGFTWDFGDGTTSTERDPLHVYAAPGYYDVRLVAQGQTGTDVAEMTVLINDENTWNISGTFYVGTDDQSVRAFDSLSELLPFLAATPITGNVRVVVRGGRSWDMIGNSGTAATVATLTALQEHLAASGYTLTLQHDGVGSAPVVQFGSVSDAIDPDVVDLFVELGANLVLDGVTLKLFGVDFNPTLLDALRAQTVLSGQATAAVDLVSVSSGLTFAWVVSSVPATASGYPEDGTGNIPSMTAVSGSPDEENIIYDVTASRGGNVFYAFTHTITLRPALEGTFTTLTPANNAQVESATVQLTWNSITNAVYDVYLWNAANERPEVPVAEGITATSFTSQGFCQNDHSYKWQVVARNAVQQIVSDEMTFTVRILPDLHVFGLQTTGTLEAGQRVHMEWTVRNDGQGSTGGQAWVERLWLMPDVYAGTNQNTCRQLFSVVNKKPLDSGQEYTAEADILIPEDTYGSYYLLVAADMSEVTLIDWPSVGGAIVNPYAPVAKVTESSPAGAYAYLFGSTAASGNVLREQGETNTRSDNFFYLKVEIAMPQMLESDWNILQSFYEESGFGEDWTEKWNFDVERRTVTTLPGVSILGGHVVSIDLHDNGLSGTFPTTLLSLPALRSLNVSGNELTGDIATTLSDAVGDGIPAAATLESLNIANNTFAGNIGAAATHLTALTTLVADGNCLSDVQPMLSAAITTLSLNNQTIDKEVTLDLREADAFGEAFPIAAVPSILRYNHRLRSFDESVSLRLTTSDDDWQAQLSREGFQPYTLSLPDGITQNYYHGASGDVIRAGNEVGTFGLKLLFAPGDANFSCGLDVTDLQAIINFAFEDYNDKPFNFTAGDLWADEDINVQDVVKMVNILLEINADEGSSVKASGALMAPDKAPAYAEASIYVSGGHVWVDTSRPVASFELTLNDAGVTTVSDELRDLGFTVRINTVGNVTRVVGYSLRGITLPEGPTPLCDVAHGYATVASAVLADSSAEAIVSKLTGIATGLDVMDDGQWTMDNCYDLSGRKVNSKMSDVKLPKGVYIINGRKVMR